MNLRKTKYVPENENSELHIINIRKRKQYDNLSNITCKHRKTYQTECNKAEKQGNPQNNCMNVVNCRKGFACSIFLIQLIKLVLSKIHWSDTYAIESFKSILCVKFVIFNIRCNFLNLMFCGNENLGLVLLVLTFELSNREARERVRRGSLDVGRS